MISSGKYDDVFEQLDDKWNATVNVNQVEKPVVIGWHGVSPIAQRTALMKKAMATDHLKYKVV